MRNIEELKKEEIEELIKDYQSPSSVITVAQIIEKYDLDIKPTKIASSLPELTVGDKCPYCDTQMVAKVKNRTEMSEPYCKQCGHILFEESGWYSRSKTCKCDNCLKAKEEENLRKKNLIENYYGEENQQFDVENLSLREKMSLCKMFKECSDESSKLYFGGMYEKYKTEVNEFYQKGVISVSPDSPIEAFSEENFPNKFYPSRVIFEINIRGLNFENMEEFFVDEYQKASASEKYDLFIEIMHKDILERFENMMFERGLGFEVLSNAEDSLKSLYDKVSYAQIITLCFRVARYYLDNTKTGKIYRKAAEKGALKSVVTFYNNNIIKGWQINNSEVKYAGSQLKYFVTNVMEKDIRILREVITIEDFE